MAKQRKMIICVGLVLVIYVGSYVLFRHSNTGVWPKNNKAYVIFPEDSKILYYLYRPLTYIDGAITGIGFHIGPHQ